MAILDAFLQRLPGSIGIRDGFGFAVGQTADLPDCTAAREAEERWTRGSAGVASEKVICLWDGATYAWASAAAGGGGGASYTDEQARDAIGTALVAGSNVTITVDDAGNTITVAATPVPATYTVTIPIGNGISVIPAGVYVDVSMPVSGAWVGWSILATKFSSGTTGSMVVDLWKDTYANHPPTVADTITAADKPTLTADAKATSSSLTGWTTLFSAGDVLRVTIDSATTVTQATLVLEYTPVTISRQAVVIPFGNGLYAPATGILVDFSMPVAGTWLSWRILGTKFSAGTTGSAVFDIWAEDYAAGPPTVADSITALAKPTLSAAAKAESSTLTGWTTAFAAGDTFRVNLDSVTTLTQGTLILDYEREA